MNVMVPFAREEVTSVFLFAFLQIEKLGMEWFNVQCAEEYTLRIPGRARSSVVRNS